MSDIPDEIMNRARDIIPMPRVASGEERYALDEKRKAIALALMAERDRALEEAAKVAKCASDDRPRRCSFEWNDGYQDGCNAAATAIRAMKGEADG